MTFKQKKTNINRKKLNVRGKVEVDNMRNDNNFFELPKQILENLENKKETYRNLLSNEVIEAYYYTNLRKDLLKSFTTFNDAKYIDKDYINISPIYGKEITKNKNKQDKISNYIASKIDKQIWAKDFYDTIMSLSTKLTYSETYYLVNTFFNNKTEEEISEILNISRFTLQKIKKSCLVKTYLELKSNENLNIIIG